MKRLIIAAVIATFATAALADDNVIVTQTKTWKSVPITVDQEKHVYTYDGTAPEGDFYYTYPGYRCLTEKRDIAGVDPVLLRASVSGGTDIYCYAE